MRDERVHSLRNMIKKYDDDAMASLIYWLVEIMLDMPWLKDMPAGRILEISGCVRSRNKRCEY